MFPFYTHVAVICVSKPPFERVRGQSLFSLTCSMKRLAKMEPTGDPIGQPEICWKWMPGKRRIVVENEL